MLNLIIATVVGYYWPFNITFQQFDLTLSNIILSTWVLFSVFGGLIWYGYLYYHWATNNLFNSKSIKWVWFIVILFGAIIYLLGPILYNIFVIEMKISQKRG